MKKCLIIDAYAFIYRSYYAFMHNPLKNAKGENVSSVHGFFNTISRVKSLCNADYLIVAFDSKGKTFRNSMYPEYKANRSKTPEDLHPQVDIIKKVLDDGLVPYYEQEDVEADDIIAFFTKECLKNDISPYIVTGDKDLLQLIKENVFAIKPPAGKKDWRIISVDDVEGEFGVSADKVIDYLSLIGDASDNIPGITGIGPKTAEKFLSKYKTLEDIYENIDDFKGKQRENIENDKEKVFLSRDLIRLRPDLVKVKFNKNDWDNYNFEKIGKSLKEEGLISASKGFTSLLNEERNEKSLEIKEGEYCFIQDSKKLKFLLNQAKLNKRISLYFHTQMKKNKINVVAISFSYQNSRAYCFKPLEENIKLLEPLLKDSKMLLIANDIKDLLKILFLNYKIKVKANFFDISIAAYLLDQSSKAYEIEELSKEYLNLQSLDYKGIIKIKDESLKEESLLQYYSQMAYYTNHLYDKLKNELELKPKLKAVYEELDLKLVKILTQMELKGIYVDEEELSLLGKSLLQKKEIIEKKIFELSGEEFNINSPAQLSKILFEKLKIKPVNMGKTNFSTADSVLEAIDLPITSLIQENRAISKLLGTYINPLLNYIDEDGRIHTTFKQITTETGRLSSLNPNLQTIPVRSEMGRQVRNCFKAKDSNHILLSSDYSQIELVVLAHLSEDKYLQKAFKEDKDIHAYTASLLFNTEDVSKEQRSLAKTINFGVLYGMSAFRLSKDLKISYDQAKNFIDQYFHRYSDLKDYMQGILEQARVDGYVRTLMGRVRPLKDINSSSPTLKSAAQRMAINTVIQGSASDIIKIAMINIDKKIKAKKLSSSLLLQVHDELIFEVPVNEKNIMQKLVTDEMSNAYKLNVPLKVSIEFSSSLGEIH